MRHGVPPSSLGSLGALPAQARPPIGVWDQGLGRVSPRGLVPPPPGGKPASVWPGTQPSSAHRDPIVHTPQIHLEGKRKRRPQRPHLWAAPCWRRETRAGTSPQPGPGVQRHRSRLTVSCGLRVLRPLCAGHWPPPLLGPGPSGSHRAIPLRPCEVCWCGRPGSPG